MVRPELEPLAVPIDEVRPYGANPRRGNIEAIKKSIEAHGQYRPVVLHRDTGEVLAGNHTLAAMRALGAERIAVVYVDGDRSAAKKIVAIDNRAPELGSVQEDKLAEILAEYDGDLDGTGYDTTDVDRMLSRIESKGLFDTALDSVNGHSRERNVDVSAVISIGTLTYYIDAAAFEEWGDVSMEEHLPGMLDWPAAPDPEAVERAKEAERAVEHDTAGVTLTGGEDIPLSGLDRLGLTFKRSDLRSIKESLLAIGQYRPIIVTTGGTIIVGHGVAAAARDLGWDTIRAVRLDVDEEQAKRIALVDHRTAELAYYDTDLLADLLSDMDDLYGSGYSSDELRSLLDEAGRLEQEEVEAPDVFLRVRCASASVDWSWRATRADFDAWHENMLREGRYSSDGVRRAIAERIGLNPDKLRVSQNR